MLLNDAERKRLRERHDELLFQIELHCEGDRFIGDGRDLGWAVEEVVDLPAWKAELEGLKKRLHDDRLVRAGWWKNGRGVWVTNCEICGRVTALGKHCCDDIPF